MDQPGLAATRPPLNCREIGLGFALMKLAIFVILLFARSDSFFLPSVTSPLTGL
jgi:hypothetical protein